MRLLLALAGLASASPLLITTYAGTVYTAALTAANASYALTLTSSTPACGANPTWLTLDRARGLVICLNEGLDTRHGSLATFQLTPNGSLTHVQTVTAPKGPVSATLYGPAASPVRGLAVAHYDGSAVSSWRVWDNGTVAPLQTFPLTLPHPGVDPDRQDAAHAHEAILHPSGRYVVVPDLGADLVRVFAIDADTLELRERDSLVVRPGSGPRHGVFWNPASVWCDTCDTFFYLVSELEGSVTAFRVADRGDGAGLQFDEVFSSPTYGPLVQPVGNAPAEIHVSPDNAYLLISNRNNTSFSLPKPSHHNPSPPFQPSQFPLPAQVPSDSLSTFRLHDDGTLEFHQLWPAGGLYPRQFEPNSDGRLAAVGLQFSTAMDDGNGAVAVLRRDVATGLLGELAARVEVEGQVTGVWFA